MQLRNPKEVTTEEYNEFYKKTFNEYLDPLASSHFTTEVRIIFFMDFEENLSWQTPPPNSKKGRSICVIAGPYVMLGMRVIF